jgi:hypothetical protein
MRIKSDVTANGAEKHRRRYDCIQALTHLSLLDADFAMEFPGLDQSFDGRPKSMLRDTLSC